MKATPLCRSEFCDNTGPLLVLNSGSGRRR